MDNETTYEYDGLGRQTKITQPDPDGGGAGLAPWTVYTYDALGNVASVTDRLGNSTTYAYDDYGRLETETDAEAGVTSYTYDDQGRMLTLTDPESNVTEWDYDRLGRVTSETNELSDTREFVYDGGLLFRRIDRMDQVIEYEYDLFGRQTGEYWYANETAADNDPTHQNPDYAITYTYDRLGRMLTVTDDAAAYDYDYDDLGRVIEETQDLADLTETIVFTYAYDAAGRRTQLAATIGVDDDFVTDYTYDDLGRVTSIQQLDQGDNAVAEKRIDFTYNVASQYDTITHYADLAATDFVATATYTFDDAYRLVGLDYTKGVTSLVEYDWSFDAASRMTAYENSIDGAVDYTLDDTNQLTDADYDYQTDEAYEYDANGNRTNGGYVTGDNNQLLFDGTYTYEYDVEGNRTLKYIDVDESGTYNSGDTDSTVYDWGHRNRLVCATNYYTWGYLASDFIDYTYDAFNRLVERTYGTPMHGGVISYYIHEGDEIVLEFRDAFFDLDPVALARRYLWNPQAVDQLFADEGVYYDEYEEEYVTYELLWALTDHQNSVRDLAEYDSGQDETTVALHRVYDAFGNETSSTGSEECLFGYTGKFFDEATQLQNNINRWYDPAIGKFISEDPIGFGAGDANLYRYVHNNPVIHTDSFGLFIEDWYPGAPRHKPPVEKPKPPVEKPKPGTHGGAQWNPGSGILSRTERCPNLDAALAIANAVVNQGECKEWFDDRVENHCAEPPDNYDIWVVPFIIWPPGAASITIPWLGNNIYIAESWCNESVSVLAEIIVHEMTHHYCPAYGDAGETCAEEGTLACSNEVMDTALNAGHTKKPAPPPNRPNPWDLPGHPVPWEPKW